MIFMRSMIIINLVQYIICIEYQATMLKYGIA